MGFSLLPLLIPSSGGTAANKNPFSYQHEVSKELMQPQFPSWALALLIVFGVMRGIIILICGAIILTPVFKGAASRKKHFFLIRRVYLNNGQKTPYIVPNRSMIIALCELLSSALYVITAYSNYRYDSDTEYPQGPLGYLLMCAYLGIWISAWSLTHACLSNVDGTTNKRTRFLTPAAYNSIWISWSLLVIGVTSFWAIRSVRVLISIERNMLQASSMLNEAANSWDIDHSFSGIPIVTLSELRHSLFGLQDQLKRISWGWAACWISFAFVLVAFYLITVRSLLRMLRELLRIRDLEIWTQHSRSTIWSEVEREICFLSGSSIALTLAIFSQICVSIYQSLSGAHLTHLKWRIGSSIIIQLPGVFMVPAQLLQSWRLFSERSVLVEPQVHTISMNAKHHDLPQTTSQLLGWDTTMYWGREPYMETSNFSGLRELPSRISTGSSNGSTHFDPEKVGMKIKVIRSTVVTRDAM
ncbi:hypothetical protein DFH28DRAFT_901413 [Melampsora americana]|nr:hypothetical protein DFH28DRAFT_901413 [Melampsora americana]